MYPPTKLIFHNAPVLDERSLEEEAERKIGWLLKLIFAGTATVIGYNIFPYMGMLIGKGVVKCSYSLFYIDIQMLHFLPSVGVNVMQQSVSLLRVKDPLFKRMGASRLARFAIDGNV